MTTGRPIGPARLDPASRRWLEQLKASAVVRDAAIGRLHALLLSEARHEVRRRTARVPHPSGRVLDDLAVQAADDALLAVLAKLDQFRGDALFTTWARRFAVLEVPGEIRRRLGRGREAPIEPDGWPPDPGAAEDFVRQIEVRDMVRALRDAIDQELTRHQREVLLELAVAQTPAKDLALRLGSTPGALYKTLHDARRKLRVRLDHTDLVASWDAADIPTR